MLRFNAVQLWQKLIRQGWSRVLPQLVWGGGGLEQGMAAILFPGAGGPCYMRIS
jgi:hypothetical protein